MPRLTLRTALTALALLLLFAGIAPRADGTTASGVPLRAAAVVFDASIDRIEDDWLVLDVPPHPSLPLPREMADWAREGDRVSIRVERARRTQQEDRIGAVLSAWHALVIERGPQLRLRSGDAGSTEFRWPDALAPAVRGGDRLDFTISPAPRAAQEQASMMARLHESMLDP